MEIDAADVYRRVTEAFTSGDRDTLMKLIADDVVWHTDDLQVNAPSEFRGRDEFFAAASGPRDHIVEWEVTPFKVISQGKTAFSHQIDRFVLKDGTESIVHLLLHIEVNDRGQLSEVWEFGQSAIPH
jgi:ketosteroid isomerase-like protein